MKKTMKFLMPVVTMVLFLSFTNKAVAAKKETVTIQTSAVCESCKNRIEKALKGTDGVLEASLNLNNKKVKVKYDPDKISVAQIKTKISTTGYDADDVKKDGAAYKSLPMCCQKGECTH